MQHAGVAIDCAMCTIVMLCGNSSAALQALSGLLALCLLTASAAQITGYYSHEPTRSEVDQLQEPRTEDDNNVCNSSDEFSKEKCRQFFHDGNSQLSKVDKIKDVEVEPTQFVIITTKEGPVDTLKVHIELVDLHDNRTLPRIDLFGLFLIVTRGRYTVPFLKPQRWYGLTFTSENVVNRETNVHKENRLLRTASRQRNGTQAQDVYEVFMHRNLDGEDSVERLYLTSRWKGKERVPAGELQVSVKVHCESSSTTEQMILHLDEDSLTIEISMDLRYDINYLDDSFHRVIAHITPLKCHKVCWQSSLQSHAGLTTFYSDAVPQCHTLKPTTSIAFLREMKRYAVEKRGSGYELVVDTVLHEATEEGLVTLTVLDLTKNSSRIRSKTFSTDSSNGTFHLAVSPDTVYAVQYEYTKIKPFHFTTKKHFLVEVARGNNSLPSFPLVEVEFHMENHTAENGDLTQSRLVTFTRSALYSSGDVLLHLEPLCEDMPTSTRTLNDRQTSHGVDVTSAICTNIIAPQYCHDRNHTTNCSSSLCYSASVVVNGDEYAGNVRCLNVSHHFPNEASCCYMSIFTFLLTFQLFVFCIYRV